MEQPGVYGASRHHPLVEKHRENLVGEGLAPQSIEQRQEELSVRRFLGIMFCENFVEAQ